MSQGEFEAPYAAAYDALYREKDYGAECDLLEEAFRRHVAEGGRRVRRVLDIGCGTGNHSLPLAERGYGVTGVDRSEPMLAAAHDKASELPENQRPRFALGDARSFALEASFDAALLMFAVLGYQLENEDVRAALQAARRHLEPGGLLVFDVWYGPAVLAQRPGERIKVVDLDDGERLIRATGGRLDVDRHLCEVSYRLFRLGADGFGDESETHLMRYFFPQELRLFLQLAGFEAPRLTAFPSLDEPCSETTWNLLGVATAA